MAIQRGNDDDIRRHPFEAIAWCLVAVVAVVLFHRTALQYDGFRQVYGFGTTSIPLRELAFFIWYGLYGTIAVCALTLASRRTCIVDWMTHQLKQLIARPVFPFLMLTLLFTEIICFRLLVLRDMPIADDEETYRFIAKTLLNGRLANPAPPDADFFKNQFIVLSGGLWYGKYPVGHPLLLAVGEAVGLRLLVVPCVTCAAAYVTYVVGKHLFSKSVAALTLLLLVLSPQFVFMGATDLSQPASALFMMLGCFAVVRITNTRVVLPALSAGLAFGFAILVRPFPGVLLVPVLGAVLLFGGDTKMRQRVFATATAALPVLAAVVILFVINRLLTGEAAKTAYHAAHSTTNSGVSGLGLFNFHKGIVSSSLGSALLRQNFWLLGWPLSFVFVLFAKPKRHALLFFGLIAAVYAYRIVVPKTVVATLGPVYVTEAVPLLLLATAAGMVRLKTMITDKGVIGGERMVGAVASASVLVALICFVPVPIRDVGVSSAFRLSLLDRVRETTKGNALVFAYFLVEPALGASWAAFPPNNAPSLTDSILWVRPKPGAEGAKENIAFWKKNYPNRVAWFLGYRKGKPFLKPVKSASDFGLSKRE